MVNVYVMNVRNLPDPEKHWEVMDGLWEERKQKILRYKNAANRKQSLGAGILLRYVLQLHEVPVEELKYGPNGKPELESICFNLSHSADLVMCAVGEDAVGCDVEKIGSAREGVARRFFTENEVQYLDALRGVKRREEFFRLWTLKESYMKMTGEGLSLGLNRLEFVLGETIQVYRDGVLWNCNVKEYNLQGYKLAVCAVEEDLAETVQYVEPEEAYNIEVGKILRSE